MKRYHRYKKAAAQDHGTDDWLMTYADMITLLFCFFAVVVSLSVPKKHAIIVPPNPPPEQHAFRESLPHPGVIISGNLTEDVGEDQAAENHITSLPDIVRQVPASTIEQQGDMTKIEMGSSVFFDKASANVSDEGKTILKNVAANLKLEKFKGYQITIEDHTDDIVVETPQYPTNWELSTARAASVVHFLLDQDIPPQKLRAAGYADTFPKLPNHDARNNPLPENQAQNRRVVIKLEKPELM